MRARYLILVAVMALSGCSVLYDIAQDRALDNCERAASAQDRQACRKANSMSYDDYEKRRQAAKEGKTP